VYSYTNRDSISIHDSNNFTLSKNKSPIGNHKYVNKDYNYDNSKNSSLNRSKSQDIKKKNNLNLSHNDLSSPGTKNQTKINQNNLDIKIKLSDIPLRFRNKYS